MSNGLSAAVRTNLFSLRKIASEMTRVQTRLATTNPHPKTKPAKPVTGRLAVAVAKIDRAVQERLR